MAETWAENNPYAQTSESMEQLQKDEHVCHHVSLSCAKLISNDLALHKTLLITPNFFFPSLKI